MPSTTQGKCRRRLAPRFGTRFLSKHCAPNLAGALTSQPPRPNLNPSKGVSVANSSLSPHAGHQQQRSGPLAREADHAPPDSWRQRSGPFTCRRRRRFVDMSWKRGRRRWRMKRMRRRRRPERTDRQHTEVAEGGAEGRRRRPGVANVVIATDAPLLRGAAGGSSSLCGTCNIPPPPSASSLPPPLSSPSASFLFNILPLPPCCISHLSSLHSPS